MNESLSRVCYNLRIQTSVSLFWNERRQGPCLTIKSFIRSQVKINRPILPDWLFKVNMDAAIFNYSNLSAIIKTITIRLLDRYSHSNMHLPGECCLNGWTRLTRRVYVFYWGFQKILATVIHSLNGIAIVFISINRENDCLLSAT